MFKCKKQTFKRHVTIKLAQIVWDQAGKGTYLKLVDNHRKTRHMKTLLHTRRHILQAWLKNRSRWSFTVSRKTLLSALKTKDSSNFTPNTTIGFVSRLNDCLYLLI